MRKPPPPTPRHLDRLPDDCRATPARTPRRSSWSVRRRFWVGVASSGLDKLDRQRRLDRHKLDRTAGGVGQCRAGLPPRGGSRLFDVWSLVVLVGFAMVGLFGYKGGVILLVGKDFGNNLTQYARGRPGSLFDPDSLGDFSLRSTTSTSNGSRAAAAKVLARQVRSALTDWESGGTHPGLRLAGQPSAVDRWHGDLPDRPRLCPRHHGPGRQRRHRDQVRPSSCPRNSNFLSFGVAKAQAAEPQQQIGLEGFFTRRTFGRRRPRRRDGR